MKTFLLSGLFISLFFIVYQDLKYRKIHILLPFFIFADAMLIVQKAPALVPIVVNIMFLLLTFGLMVLYMSLKNKAYLNPFEHYFGLGDLLFFIAITPLFVLRHYIAFFIAAMLFSIAFQLILAKFRKMHTVPLAGFAAVLLLLTIIVEYVFKRQFTLIS